MKKKIAYITTLAAVSVGCFFIGRNTAINQEVINVADIVDWNTNGEELAITLKNNYECYATKSENIYKPELKDYVGFDEIKEIIETETIYEIVTVEGNIYTVKK